MNHPILLVEDEENDIFFMKRALKQVGVTHSLQVAEDGQAAIDYLKETVYTSHNVPTPCLVLLDLKLPRVMGLEVLKWIRQKPELKNLIVIVLTSSKIQSDIDTAYRFGANSYLVKPAAEKLLEIARLIKEYWLNLNQLPSECEEPASEMAGRH